MNSTGNQPVALAEVEAFDLAAGDEIDDIAILKRALEQILDHVQDLERDKQVLIEDKKFAAKMKEISKNTSEENAALHRFIEVVTAKKRTVVYEQQESDELRGELEVAQLRLAEYLRQIEGLQVDMEALRVQNAEVITSAKEAKDAEWQQKMMLNMTELEQQMENVANEGKQAMAAQAEAFQEKLLSISALRSSSTGTVSESMLKQQLLEVKQELMERKSDVASLVVELQKERQNTSRNELLAHQAKTQLQRVTREHETNVEKLHTENATMRHEVKRLEVLLSQSQQHMQQQQQQHSQAAPVYRRVQAQKSDSDDSDLCDTSNRKREAANRQKNTRTQAHGATTNESSSASGKRTFLQSSEQPLTKKPRGRSSGGAGTTKGRSQLKFSKADPNDPFDYV